MSLNFKLFGSILVINAKDIVTIIFHKSFQKTWHYLVLKRFHCYFAMVDMWSVQNVTLITSITNIWFFCLFNNRYIHPMRTKKTNDVFNRSWATSNDLKLYVNNFNNVLHSFILRLFSNFVGDLKHLHKSGRFRENWRYTFYNNGDYKKLQ